MAVATINALLKLKTVGHDCLRRRQQMTTDDDCWTTTAADDEAFRKMILLCLLGDDWSFMGTAICVLIKSVILILFNCNYLVIPLWSLDPPLIGNLKLN